MHITHLYKVNIYFMKKIAKTIKIYLFNFLKDLLLCVCMFSLDVCLCTICVPYAFRGQRRCQTPWNWSCRCLWTAIWVLNSAALKEQKVFWTSEPTLSLLILVWMSKFSTKYFLNVWTNVDSLHFFSDFLLEIWNTLNQYAYFPWKLFGFLTSWCTPYKISSPNIVRFSLLVLKFPFFFSTVRWLLVMLIYENKMRVLSFFWF